MHSGRDTDRRSLASALALIVAFMAVEVVTGILASSLALLSDAGHMLIDAAGLAISLTAARLAARPAYGAMTFGLGRAEILSAQANGLTLLVLAGLIIYGAVVHLVSPPAVDGGVVLGVALAGIPINLLAVRILAGGHGYGHGHEHGPAEGHVHEHERSLNVEGSYRHVLTDLYGFVATAIAGALILATGFARADAIASLLIAGLMLYASWGLLKASGRVFMEAAPAGLDPDQIGHALAAQAGVVEVHDLHVWEVTSGFAALSAHVVVRAGDDCHELRRSLHSLLEQRFDIHHTTLQVDHELAPLQIELAPHSGRGQ